MVHIIGGKYNRLHKIGASANFGPVVDIISECDSS